MRQDKTHKRIKQFFSEVFCNMELDKSVLMQKQVKDNSEDLQREFLDLKNWEEQMKRKEKELLNERDEHEVFS